MSLWLTDDELVELTGKKQRKKQIEVLSLLRGDPAKHHFTLHPVRDGNVVWIVRPHRVAEMQRRAHLRSGSLDAR